jgi:hypothetical protein
MMKIGCLNARMVPIALSLAALLCTSRRKKRPPAMHFEEAFVIMETFANSGIVYVLPLSCQHPQNPRETQA